MKRTTIIIALIVVLVLYLGYRQYRERQISLQIGPAEITPIGEVPIGEDGVYQYHGSDALKE